MKLYTPKTKIETITDKDGKEKEIEVPLVTLNLYESIDGKNYYYAQAIPKDCEEKSTFGTPEEEAVFLKTFKDRGLFDKNNAFSATIKNFLDAYIKQEELLSWDMQFQEATHYKANPDIKNLSEVELNKAYPLVCNLCLARFGSLKNLNALVEKILEKSQIYKVISGNLIGQKQKMQDAIENAKTMEELLSVLDSEIDLSVVVPSGEQQ